MWAVAAAAVVALIVAGAWWTLRSPTGDAVVATTIDLRPFAVMRGDTQSPPPPPIVIPRGRLDATIVLPLGAEPGIYDVQLRDPALLIRGQSTGAAALRGSMTTLRVSMNTSGFAAGAYQLEMRRRGGEWRHFQARLH